jgi:hypothetical protein
MSKKSAEQKLLAESLSNALDPQRKRGMPREALDQYDEAPKTPVTRVTDGVAPKRDFTRTANSIVREAVPAGAFTGKGKQLYDYLYQKTRGAILPVRSVRLPTEQVMKGAGMSRPTYRNHINRLMHLGLVEVDERPGEHGGNLFTVFLPEEVGFERGNRGNTSYRGDTGKNLDGQQGKEPYPGNTGLSADFQRASDTSKTLIQDKERIDDEAAPGPAQINGTAENLAFAEFLEVLTTATREITGKTPGPLDRARWRELAEVLSVELKIAAGRTTVSSVPAFLAEHLKRRLWKREGKDVPGQKNDSSPPGASALVNFKDCPDCFGTGMWYPEGYEKGVARCCHEKLSAGE